MIHILIEMWPKGHEKNKRLLGEAFITNDCTGTKTRGNYVYSMFGKKGAKNAKGGDNKPLKNGVGVVDEFPRLQRNVWYLILHMLLKYSKYQFIGTSYRCDK